MLGSRPLYDNRADADYFVLPPAWDRLTKAVTNKLNALVVGPRGAGKTSLLHQQELALRNEGRRVAFVDATAMGSAEELAARVRDVLAGRPAAFASASRAVQTLVARDLDPPVAGASQQLHETLREIGEAPSSVILVDASASGDAVYGLFGRLRDVLWQQDHVWVVAIDETDLAIAQRPPADAFFDVTVELGQWSIDDLAHLLELRAGEVPAALRREIASRSDGNPRAAMRALGEASLGERDPTEALAERGELAEKASALGRPYGMLMAELLDRGQAGPSDESLQMSLGLSRGRLTDYLRTLLSEQLVVAEPQPSDKPGRPRTVYRPALERR
jgi:energy-coupling factor transporter ATP-binding protein EcfA2